MTIADRDQLADLIWRVETRDLGGLTPRDAESVADALLAAGVTLPDPTAETRTEWGVRYRSSDGDEYTHASTSRYRAEHIRDEILAEEPHFAPTLVKRTVTTAAWTTPEEKP